MVSKTTTKLSATRRVIEHRRRKWARCRPPDGAFVHTDWARTSLVLGDASRPVEYSYLGLGLLVAQKDLPEISWEELRQDDYGVRWGIEDSTELLANFYGMSPSDVDELYSRQIYHQYSHADLDDYMLGLPVLSDDDETDHVRPRACILEHFREHPEVDCDACGEVIVRDAGAWMDAGWAMNRLPPSLESEYVRKNWRSICELCAKDYILTYIPLPSR